MSAEADEEALDVDLGPGPEEEVRVLDVIDREDVEVRPGPNQSSDESFPVSNDGWVVGTSVDGKVAGTRYSPSGKVDQREFPEAGRADPQGHKVAGHPEASRPGRFG